MLLLTGGTHSYKWWSILSSAPGTSNNTKSLGSSLKKDEQTQFVVNRFNGWHRGCFRDCFLALVGLHFTYPFLLQSNMLQTYSHIKVTLKKQVRLASASNLVCGTTLWLGVWWNMDTGGWYPHVVFCWSDMCQAATFSLESGAIKLSK